MPKIKVKKQYKKEPKSKEKYGSFFFLKLV